AIFCWLFDEPHAGYTVLAEVHVEFGIEHVEPGAGLQQFIYFSGMDLDTASAADKYHDIKITFGSAFQYTLQRWYGNFRGMAFRCQAHGLTARDAEFSQ